ncbi:MAG: hypothetical protein R3E97_21920 [Candidatus Eisenbacteria bacterium]
MLAQLNLVLWAWLESLKDLGRFRVWRPFLFLALVQVVVLLVMTQFFRPGLSSVLAPLVEHSAGPGAKHYPQFYLALPMVFSKLNFAIDLLVGSFALGVAMLVVWVRIAGTKNADPWGLGRRRIVALILVRLPLLLLLYLLAWQLPGLLFPVGVEVSGSQIRLLRYSTFVVGALIETFFVYAPVFLLFERKNPLAAWKDAVAFLGRVPIASFLVVAVPSLLQLPVSYILRRAGVVVETLSPELVTGLIVGAILIFAFINFLIVGSVVRIYGARRENPGGGLVWS